LDSIGDGVWKTIKIKLPIEIFKGGADPNYHCVHIQQLRVLYKMTEEEIFKKYELLFEDYYKAMSNNLWWKDIICEINQKENKENK